MSFLVISAFGRRIKSSQNGCGPKVAMLKAVWIGSGDVPTMSKIAFSFVSGWRANSCCVGWISGCFHVRPFALSMCPLLMLVPTNALGAEEAETVSRRTARIMKNRFVGIIAKGRKW